MDSKRIYLGVDVGGQRVGLAVGDSIGRIAQPLKTIVVNGGELPALQSTVSELDVTDLVVGRPRNQAGEQTAQTQSVEEFARSYLQPLGLPLHWQDESITSVLAEERLKSRKKPYAKGDIDAEAASIILQDYLEQL